VIKSQYAKENISAKKGNTCQGARFSRADEQSSGKISVEKTAREATRKNFDLRVARKMPGLLFVFKFAKKFDKDLDLTYKMAVREKG